MSRFYISLEDDLMRLFGGERITTMMDRLNVDEDTPIETKMLSNTIEGAQRKIEGRNFGIRKNVLQYDDVLSRQREVIYQQRNEVLDGKDIHDQIMKMIDQSIEEQVKRFLPAETVHDEWNLQGLKDYYLGWLLVPDDLTFTKQEIEELEPEFVIKTITDRAHLIYENREKQFGETITRELERVILLKNVDSEWMDHIDAMEELKRGIRLRAYAQRDPVVEYRVEGFDMFEGHDPHHPREHRAHDADRPPAHAGGAQARAGGQAHRHQRRSDRRQAPREKGQKIGPNDPCPCGSGKKFKKCTCAEYHSEG